MTTPTEKKNKKKEKRNPNQKIRLIQKKYERYKSLETKNNQDTN